MILRVSRAVAIWGAVGFGFGWGALACAEEPAKLSPAPRAMHIEVRALGSGPVNGGIRSDTLQEITLAFKPGLDGTAVAQLDLVLAPADDSRDQRTLWVQRPGFPTADAALPLSIITYVAPSSVSIAIPDLRREACAPAPALTGGEAYWVGRYLQTQALYRTCKLDGLTSQKTLDAMDYLLAARNRLTELDPAIFSVEEDLIGEAQSTIANADLCSNRPAVECTNIQRELTWASIADYKLLTVAQSVESHLSELSDAEVEAALRHISTGRDAFTRCKGDLKDKCGVVHTSDGDYLQTLKRFCAAAAGRQIPSLEEDYKCPKF